ncbi:MAG: pilus assembly protein TadG-related protein [Candidatus Humimicrobiaceae bacterium]
MNKFCKKFKNEKGQVAIIVGILIIPLVMMLAYVIDVGSMYQTRRNAQTAADAAALAGVQNLPEDPAGAISKAIEYAQYHGNVTLTEGEIQILENDTKIVVTPTDASTPLFFSGIFGINSETIGATATAKVYSPAGIKGLVPFIIDKADIEYGESVTLKANSPKDPGHEPGEFQAMDFYDDGDPWDDPNPPPGGGASAYKYYIENGYGGEVRLDEMEEVEAGNMSGPTMSGVETRIGADTCTLEEVTEIRNGELTIIDPSCPRVILVPITDAFPPNPSDPLQITGFAIFFITEADSAEVTGQFIEMMQVTSSGEVKEYDGGIKVIRLIE